MFLPRIAKPAGCRARRNCLLFTTAIGGAMLVPATLHAATLFWDPLSHPTTASDASGTWNNATGIWSNGTSDTVWNSASSPIAIFGAGGTGTQTVTLAANISAGGLTFNNGSNYKLTGNAITLSSNSTITVNNSATIGCDLYSNTGNISINVTRATGGDLNLPGTIHGTAGLIKLGPGAVTISGNNIFTGNVNISGGTLIATHGQDQYLDGTLDSSLGSGSVSGRNINIGPGATLLLTSGPPTGSGAPPDGANAFGNGASDGIVNSDGTYTRDPNLPTITVNAGTFSSTRYTAIGNITLNAGLLTQASIDAVAGAQGIESYYQGFQFIGSVTVGGSSPSTIAATANSVDGTIGADHLGPNTVFNVAKTGSITETLDLVVSSPLIDQSTDFNNYSVPDTFSHSPGRLTKSGAGTMSLTASNNYSGGTNVSAGTLIFAAPGALPIDTGLTISAGAIAIAANHGSSPRNSLFASSLTIAGSTNAWTGKLDLTNNDLDVQNGSLATLTNQVKQGYNPTGGGNWNGNAGITSSTAYADTKHLTALGVIQNSVNGSPTGTALYYAFDGIAVSATDVLVKFTYYGDANLDGKVDGSDYSRIDNGLLMHATGWFNGDFNYDGVVNGSDYALIDNAYNTQTASLAVSIAAVQAVQFTDASGTSVGSVPEPGFVCFGFALQLFLLGRRRPRVVVMQ